MSSLTDLRQTHLIGLLFRGKVFGEFMKKHSSRFIRTLAHAYLAFPLIYPIFCAVLFDIPMTKLVTMVLQPLFYMVCFWAVITGWGLREMHRWSWYVFLIANVFIAYANTLYVVQYGESHNRVISFLISLLLLLFVSFRVAREIRVPYFFPRIRWWESNPRYRLSVPGRVMRAKQDWTPAEILDLSMGGCFLKFLYDVMPDEPVRVTFEAYGLEFECAGTIVWRTGASVTHPKGIGIKFGPLTKTQKRTLKAINEHLHRISALYRKTRFLLSQEEFEQKLKELQSQKISLKEA